MRAVNHAMGKEGIRIGLIGCGRIARYHLANLLSMHRVKVVAMADPNPKGVEGLRRAFPGVGECGVFRDYIEMLDSTDLDAVEILTPHVFHFEQIMESLSRGLHALVEKPMVCSVDHARKVIAKADETSKIVLVSYQDRYGSKFRRLKLMIQSGKLGEIQFVSALQCENWFKIHRDTWRQDPALSGGGQLIDGGSHLLDMVLWATGSRATEVFAHVDKLGSQVDINSALAIQLDDGAVANISIVGNSPRSWEDMTFFGEKGAILYRNGRILQSVFGSRDTRNSLRPPSGSNPDRNFIRSILGREAVESPPTCGLYIAELTEAAYRSAEQDRVIRIHP
jgi:predicted dehydrogenase